MLHGEKEMCENLFYFIFKHLGGAGLIGNTFTLIILWKQVRNQRNQRLFFKKNNGFKVFFVVFLDMYNILTQEGCLGGYPPLLCPFTGRYATTGTTTAWITLNSWSSKGQLANCSPPPQEQLSHFLDPRSAGIFLLFFSHHCFVCRRARPASTSSWCPWPWWTPCSSYST